MQGQKTCFVVMGYGKKTDFATGRTLDLDKTYRNVIKPAVEACGLRCIRADEIRHSGVIDVPMYQQLQSADLVIADLSTTNPNALYELGVRHALRRSATIVIAESQLKYPFDVNHTAIRSYRHLGEGIEYEEVMRFRGVLEEAIRAVLAQPQTDSPVYTYLPDLSPPSAAPTEKAEPAAPVHVLHYRAEVRGSGAIAQGEGATAAGAGGIAIGGDVRGDVTVAADETQQAVGPLLQQANAAIDRSDFATAKTMLATLRAMKPEGQPWTANDDYLTQRLALAIYKDAQPTAREALEAARELLSRLHPESSNDPETLGLWGAVHKRLWDETKDQAHLDAAILAYERGFFLRQDYYNGINLAFLLNVRASVGETPEAIADFVQANRIRRSVIAICNALIEGKDLATGQFTNRETSDTEARYSVRATLAEAWLGVGDTAESDRWLSEAMQFEVPAWMRETAQRQLQQLKALVADSPLVHIRS